LIRHFKQLRCPAFSPEPEKIPSLTNMAGNSINSGSRMAVKRSRERLEVDTMTVIRSWVRSRPMGNAACFTTCYYGSYCLRAYLRGESVYGCFGAGSEQVCVNFVRINFGDNMPLFHIEHNEKLTMAKPTNFKLEKVLQNLIENNLQTVFNCRFIATEFPTGTEHGGRIDTLALSEDNNPVIIEYKKVESSELINQSLYYLSWIKDHRGDFQVIVNKTLGKSVEKIDWDDVRVICIAPGYKKFDLHAVQMMGANIELWQYRLYDTNTLYFEEIFRKSTAIISVSDDSQSKNPVMVAAGKKAALTRLNGSYTVDEHLNNCDNKIKQLFQDLREYILGIDSTIEETPKKFYVAYKASQNFVCIETKKSKLLLFLKIVPSKIIMPKNGRDVSDIGHYGTGDFELTISTDEDVENSKEFIGVAFENIGG
jgi:predicted transport protein